MRVRHNVRMTYQHGINAYGTTDHVYLELDLVQGADAKEAIGKLAAAVNLPTTVGANAVVGVRPELWAELADAANVPANVHGFNEPIRGADGYEMPATQHDAWLWVASASRSESFNVSRHILDKVAGLLDIADETIGWVYEGNRDLTGFEDGTENPGALEVPSVIAVPAGEPGAGSSVLLFQKWPHLVKPAPDRPTERAGRRLARIAPFGSVRRAAPLLKRFDRRYTPLGGGLNRPEFPRLRRILRLSNHPKIGSQGRSSRWRGR